MPNLTRVILGETFENRDDVTIGGSSCRRALLFVDIGALQRYFV